MAKQSIFGDSGRRPQEPDYSALIDQHRRNAERYKVTRREWGLRWVAHVIVRFVLSCVGVAVFLALVSALRGPIDYHAAMLVILLGGAMVTPLNLR